MAALKLFISHSSRLRDDEANDLLAQRNWQLLQNTRQALDTEYGNKIETLVDYQELYPGIEWEQRLHELLYECHAAIILFSRRALEESDWVKMEATILHSRARLDREFKLVPVLLAGQTATPDLDVGFFGTLGISRWQHLSNAATAQNIVDGIKPILGEPAILGGDQQTTFQKLHGTVERLITNNIDRESLKELWCDLFPGTTPPLTHCDPVTRHARALAQHLLGEGKQSLQHFQNVITGLQPKLLSERAEELLKYIRALWVEEEAAAQIRRAGSKNGQCLALNGQYVAQTLAESNPQTVHYTLNRYLERAWPNSRVKVIQVLNPWKVDEKASKETAKDVIQRQIRNYFRGSDEAAADEFIDRRICQIKPQIAVFLSAEHWSDGIVDSRLIPVLQELKTLYSPLIFVFGVEGQMPDALPADVVPVLPKLELSTEQEQYYSERDAWDLINNT